MKKIIPIFCVVFFWCSQIYAQTTVIDRKGTRTQVDTSKWSLSGLNISNKNTGNVGIGISSPIYKLDVLGKVRISDSLVANTGRFLSVPSGTTLDSILVIDPVNGNLKRISASRLRVNDSTTANNGLTLTGKNVQFGGTLIQATTLTQNSQTLTIATGGTALNITGLTSGSVVSDSVLVIDPTSGRIKRTSYSLPSVLVSATRTTAYTITANPNYAILPYNTATINTGSAYNTTSGVFTAPSTGVYQVLVHNMLTSTLPANSNASLRVVVNGATDTEVALAFSPYFGAVFGTIAANTIVDLTAGQTINIQMGNASGTIAPSIGTSQHTLKIIRLR